MTLDPPPPRPGRRAPGALGGRGTASPVRAATEPGWPRRLAGGAPTPAAPADLAAPAVRRCPAVVAASGRSGLRPRRSRRLAVPPASAAASAHGCLGPGLGLGGSHGSAARRLRPQAVPEPGWAPSVPAVPGAGRGCHRRLGAGCGDAGLAGHFREGVGGIGLGGFVPALGAGLAEHGLAEGVEGGHDAGADLGVVAAVEVPFALGVGEGPQRAALVDATAAASRVDLSGGGLGPGALFSQLGQRRAAGRLQQIVLGGRRPPGPRRRWRPPARPTARPGGRPRGLGQGTPTAGRCRSPDRGLNNRRPRSARQLVGRRTLAFRPPRANLGQPGQTLEIRRDLLDPRRLLDHLSRPGPPTSTAASKPAAYPLSDSRNSRRSPRPWPCLPSERSNPQGEVQPATTELVFVYYHLPTAIQGPAYQSVKIPGTDGTAGFGEPARSVGEKALLGPPGPGESEAGGTAGAPRRRTLLQNCTAWRIQANERATTEPSTSTSVPTTEQSRPPNVHFASKPERHVGPRRRARRSICGGTAGPSTGAGSTSRCGRPSSGRRAVATSAVRSA